MVTTAQIYFVSLALPLIGFNANASKPFSYSIVVVFEVKVGVNFNFKNIFVYGFKPEWISLCQIEWDARQSVSKRERDIE